MTLRELIENIQRIKELQELKTFDDPEIFNKNDSWELDHLLSIQIKEVEYDEE